MKKVEKEIRTEAEVEVEVEEELKVTVEKLYYVYDEIFSVFVCYYTLVSHVIRVAYLCAYLCLYDGHVE